MRAKRYAAALLAAIVGAVSLQATARDVLPLADNWRFIRGDAAGAEQFLYNDSAWRVVQVPHDWSIEGPFDETNQAAGAGAFLPAGPVWYRKHFSLPAKDLDQKVYVEFDGVRQSCDVWINGMHLGHHALADAGFIYELPNRMLNIGGGAANVLTVCAETSSDSAPRDYVGGGIYRPVRLVVVNPAHIVANGVRVTTPVISSTTATAQIELAVTNESLEPHEFSAQTRLFAPDGELAGNIESGQTIDGGTAVTVEQPIAFSNPQFWNPDEPGLYSVVIKSFVDRQLVDEKTTTFCVRTLHEEPGTGWALNGTNLTLRCVTVPADGGAFGVAVPLSIWEMRLKTLKSLGVNAIHPAHPPVAPEVSALCDRLGLLVVDDAADCAVGVDYLGGSNAWPLIGSDSGLLDRTGAIRPAARAWQSKWSDRPMLAIARESVVSNTPAASTDTKPSTPLQSDWTPQNLKPHPENVVVYSNCKEVELLLNGKSLGKKAANADASPRQWPVSFAPGVLRAIARDGNGRGSLTNELRTAGKPYRILLTMETKNLSPNADDVAMVRASVVDAHSIIIPYANDVITFKISGPSVIAAVDNADNASHEPFQASARHLFQGACVAYVRATASPGKITVTATTTAKLKPGVIIIHPNAP